VTSIGLKGNALMKRFGMVLFYIGGLVWVVYAVVKFLLGWDVNIRQFLPYHLAAVIPGIILKHGIGLYERLKGKSHAEKNTDCS
jgi:hypothetical protein